MNPPQVVDFEGFRLRLQAKKRDWDRTDKRCAHLNLTLDDQGHIVWCDDCKQTVSAYWAIQMLAERHAASLAVVERREKALAQDKAQNLHLTAAKKVEKAWRSRTMVPACPHCDRGILPEDGLGGTQVNRAIELARRRHDPGNRPGRPIPDR